MVEPPPAYSSQTTIDKIQLRGEDKKKKRGLFLSPFTFCIAPKTFATIHASISFLFCTIGIVYATIGEPFGEYLILVCCAPFIPFFLSALIGIRKNRQNFVLLAAFYMIVSFVIMFVPTVIWVCINIPYMHSTNAEARAYSRILTIPVIVFMTPFLLFISHAARVYLRVYYDIRDERKERNAGEIKLPLV